MKRVDCAYVRAAQCGQLQYADVVRAIVKGLDVNPVDDHCSTALQRACQYGRIPQIQWLLALGADVNECEDVTCFPPLFETIFACQHESLRVLLEAGAEVDKLDSNHLSAILYFHFCMWRNEACLDTILSCSNVVLSDTYKGKTVQQTAIVLDNRQFALRLAAEAACRSRWSTLRALWVGACSTGRTC
jgi:hypothetical protein